MPKITKITPGFERGPTRFELSFLGLSNERAPVQADPERGKSAGTVAWWEHELAWHAYEECYGSVRSVDRIAELSGFSYDELVEFLGHEPQTWEPVSHKENG